jgi:hypothetical protein
MAMQRGKFASCFEDVSAELAGSSMRATLDTRRAWPGGRQGRSRWPPA